MECTETNGYVDIVEPMQNRYKKWLASNIWGVTIWVKEAHKGVSENKLKQRGQNGGSSLKRFAIPRFCNGPRSTA